MGLGPKKRRPFFYFQQQISGTQHTGCFFFFTGTHQKVLSAKKLIYVNVDSPNLGFPYFNFLEGVPVKKNTLYHITLKAVIRSVGTGVVVTIGVIHI